MVNNKYLICPVIILLLTGLYECSMFLEVNQKINIIWFITTISIQLVLFIILLRK
jgi:hypothetical protein